MLEHLPDGDALFTALSERRPVTRHRVVKRQRAALGQHVHCERDQRLARGEQEEQCIRLAAECLVEHDLAARDDADLRVGGPVPG